MMWFENMLNCDYEWSIYWLLGIERGNWFEYEDELYYISDNKIWKAVRGVDGFYRGEEVNQREAIEIILHSGDIRKVVVWSIDDQLHAKSLISLFGSNSYVMRADGTTIISSVDGNALASFWDSKLFDKLPDGIQGKTMLGAIRFAEFVPGTKSINE